MSDEAYWEWPGLRGVYLEDSWVRSVRVEVGVVVFDLDAVLLDDHPMYRAPKANEAYWYRRATLTFRMVQSIEWSMTVDPAIDASGEVDFGNIDSLTRGGSHYRLEGGWGSMRLTASILEFRIRSADDQVESR